MKISKIWSFLAMFAAVFFTACDPNNGDTTIVDDGMYVVGEATVNTQLEARLLMAAGINEVDKTKREGMYEKYIALEANKDFWLVFHKAGQTDVVYGTGDFGATALKTDNQPFQGYSGKVVVDGTPMRVAESGLYHVVMDLDADGSVGEKYILVAPANFGVRGAMNGWGYTSYTASEFNKETITFTSPEDITIRKNQEFKFAYANPGATDGAWKIVLDTLRDAVKAEISLGEGLVTGADNIVFSENSAIYQVQLQWTLSLGENKNSFKVVYTKTGDVPYTDPATQVISLIGSAFNNNEGSPADWNFDVDLAYVATDANGVSTYSTVIDLIPGDFKVRLAHDWGTNWGYDSSKITGDTGNVSDNGGNIKVAAAKKYKVTFSYNWESFEWVGLDLTVQ